MFYSENDICLPKRGDYSADYSFKKKIFKITRKIYKYFCFLKENPNAKKKKKKKY